MLNIDEERRFLGFPAEVEKGPLIASDGNPVYVGSRVRELKYVGTVIALVGTDAVVIFDNIVLSTGYQVAAHKLCVQIADPEE